MTPDLPDLAGFREAQVRLVAALGNDCTFYFPASASVWPASTAIDPETNRPLDPMVEPLAMVGPAPVEIRATVVDRLGMGRNYGDLERIGLIPEGAVILRMPVDAADFNEGVVHARQFQTMDQTYRIIRIWMDGVGGTADRMMVVGEMTDGLDPTLFTPPASETVVVGPNVTETLVATAGQTAFPTSYQFDLGSTEVYLDGIRMAIGPTFDYTESGQAIIFNYALTGGETVIVSYAQLGTSVQIGPSQLDGQGEGMILYQNIPAETWYFQHNLGMTPTVDVFDSTGNLLMVPVNHTSINEFNVEVGQPMAGWVVIAY